VLLVGTHKGGREERIRQTIGELIEKEYLSAVFDGGVSGSDTFGACLCTEMWRTHFEEIVFAVREDAAREHLKKLIEDW
jgi:hypothetical protein